MVGAGLGGIAAGVKLRQAGIRTFTIYESSPGVGGTWWDNTYPGAEVDVHSNLYRYSFKSVRLDPHPCPPARAAGVPRRDGRPVRPPSAPPAGGHRRVGHVGRRPARLVGHARRPAPRRVPRASISAVGFLNVPRYPDWPGLEEFAGPKFHTARWEHQHDLSDKDVAVVGPGRRPPRSFRPSSPVGKLYLFQREPGWVMPKGERDLTDAERRRLARPWRRALDRATAAVLPREGPRGARPPSDRAPSCTGKRQQTCLDYIAREFADHPDLQKAVTPTYPYPGKRPVIASTFYPALKADNVELVPRAVSRVTPSGIVDADGVERAVDVIVMATGFRGGRLPGPPPGHRAARARPSRNTGPASRGPIWASPCRASPTSSCSTGRAPTGVSWCPCSRPRPSTRSGP